MLQFNFFVKILTRTRAGSSVRFVKNFVLDFMITEIYHPTLGRTFVNFVCFDFQLVGGVGDSSESSSTHYSH